MELTKVLGFRNCITLFLFKTSSVCNIKKCTSNLRQLTPNYFSSLTASHEASMKSNKMNENLGLVPFNPVLIPACGMKVRGQLALRCKDCYFERKDGQLYVNCPSYPRHKQVAMSKRRKYQWILTYAFQSKKRPW